MAKKTTRKPTADETREAAVEAGITAIRADYYSTIRSIAEDIKRRIGTEIMNADDLQTELHQTADGNYYTIYTHANLRALMASDNWLAAEDAHGEFSNIGSGGSTLSDVLAIYVYHAIEADIVQALESMDVDVDDPCPAADEDTDTDGGAL